MKTHSSHTHTVDRLSWSYNPSWLRRWYQATSTIWCWISSLRSWSELMGDRTRKGNKMRKERGHSEPPTAQIHSASPSICRFYQLVLIKQQTQHEMDIRKVTEIDFMRHLCYASQKAGNNLQCRLSLWSPWIYSSASRQMQTGGKLGEAVFACMIYAADCTR